MDNTKYAEDNFHEATSRQEYTIYATGNAYAEQDVAHFKDVAFLVQKLWQAKFGKTCPEALTIAALYHDFDRVFPKSHSSDPKLRTSRRAIDTRNISDAEYGKSNIKNILHPQNCAAIFKEYNPQLPVELCKDVMYLIERHETGPDEAEKIDSYASSYNLSSAAAVLCEADAISFFSVILPVYVKGREERRVKEKIKFSYAKLSPEGKQIVQSMQFPTIRHNEEDINLNDIVRETILQ